MASDGGLDSRTALVILPPAEFTTEVQVLRQRHDRAFARWPPHLRICWPFVPVRTALARFGQTRLTIPAFDLELASVGLLNSEAHGDRDRVYVALQPSTASVQSLDLLRREVLRIFPECEAGDAGDAFHLTLGQLPLGEAESLVNSAESSLERHPLKWRCESVTLMACHSSAEPLKPMHEIQLAETSRPFEPPPRLAGSRLPSLAWRSVLKALPLRDASRMARALEHQDVGRADWWSELTEDFFGEGCNQGLSTFCSLVGAAGFASNLSWAAVPNSAGEVEMVEVCKGVQEFEDPPAAREVVPLLSGSARCARHTSSRVAVLGALGKESSLALWNLNSHEKPRFNKLKGHVASFDLWEELLLVLGKGGSLSLHDLTDPRSQATSLGKKDDGHALAVHWMHGRAVVAYPKKVALINVESGAAESLPSLCDPVLCPLDEQLLAVATGTSWLLWDVRRPSNVTPVPSGFRCQALARLDDTSALAAGDGALWWMDLRMERWSRWVQLPKRADRDVSVKCLLPGHSCVSAQFEDQTLATWHRGSGIRMGWWPSSRCLSLPSGAAAWDGIAAADTQLYLAGVSRNGGSSSRAEGKKVDAKKVPKPDAKKEVKGHAKKVDATSAKGASQKSQKLRTSEDVYHRILHDSTRFDPKDIAIGYEDRFLGPMELQLVDFKPGGDLPFHRIYYFRRGAKVLWDRKHRLDRIFNEMGAASSVAAETVEAIRRAQRTAEKIEQGLIKVRGRGGGRKAAPPPVEVAGMRFVAEKDCWMPCPAVQSVRLEELKVLTLNVLFELYGDVETHLQVRMAHIFAELHKSEADVILLQEVTPSFAEMLLQQVWVRDHYWSSCGEQTDSVDPSGQLTLSKWPVRSVLCARLSQHKTVVLTTILASLGRARAVLVANLHLAADLLDDSGPSSRQEHRAEQLKTCEEVLHDRLRPGDLGLIAGDFNDAAPVLSGEFLDAWVEANPQEEGYTFDPTVNRVAQQVIAAVNGRTEPRRIDRIYVAAGAEGGWLMDARLVGTEAFYEASIESGKQPWYLSDHFGVLCKIRAAVAAGAEERVLLHKPADVLQPEVLEALSLGSEVELVLLGSAALGIADAGSDVDLLACSASLSQPRFFARAAEALDAVGADVECASDATVPLIRFQAKDGRQVEVQFMELSTEHILQLRDSHTAVDGESHAFEALEAQLFVPKEFMQVSLAAALDVWALSRQLGGRFELFRQLAVAVKRWARERQLLGTAFGFPGGFAWALMASREVLLSPDDDVQKIQATFFQNAAKKLSDETPKLWCPAGPQDRNALRSMTRGTAQILRAQLEVPLGGTGPLEAPRFLVVEMAAAAETKPRLQRKAIPILLEVERCVQGTAWPLTDVHCSRRGMPCLVMGLESWTPTAGEQRAMAKSMKTSTGLDVEVRLVSVDHLRAEIPSVTE